MTGFGFCSVNHSDFMLEISIKSINSRFLDSKFYTAHYYLSLESELKKILFQKCKRGYFVVHINRFPQRPNPAVSFQWNKDQAKKWQKLYKQLSKELNCENDLNLSDLINREGVLNVIEKPQSLSLKEKNQVKQTFKKSLQLCLRERQREGLSLKKDILSQLKKMQALNQKISLLNKKQQAVLLKKKSQLKNNSYKESHLELEKSDIHEEIIRTQEHLNHFKRILNKAQDVGRKLDFYSQEILRELNTMGSKSQTSELTLNVVSAKSCLEKIKEQIQNVE